MDKEAYQKSFQDELEKISKSTYQQAMENAKTRGNLFKELDVLDKPIKPDTSTVKAPKVTPTPTVAAEPVAGPSKSKGTIWGKVKKHFKGFKEWIWPSAP